MNVNLLPSSSHSVVLPELAETILVSSRLQPVISNIPANPHEGSSQRHRTLRARTSDPPKAADPSAKPSSPTVALRKPSQKELNYVHWRLGVEGIAIRREELARQKEKELKAVVEGHDDAVREKFHLEKFVTLLEGWDPKVSYLLPGQLRHGVGVNFADFQEAKHDNSPVFQEVSHSFRHKR